MRLITSLLIVGCILSLAHGQWVERTTVIPDSLSGLTNPGTMIYNTGNNFLFVGGDNGPAIIDGLTDRLIVRASRGGLGQYRACYAAPLNKLYWIGGENGGRTFVLDGATGRDLASIATPNARDICYNPMVNRVYVPARDTSGYLIVINAANDSVLGKLSVGVGSQSSVACAPAENKVYVMSDLDGTVTVIDCDVDSIVDTLTVGVVPGQLVYNRISNKLYRCGWDATVTIIDCHSDTILGRVVLPGGIETAVYNPAADKLYCDDGEGICIISGQGDSLLGRVPLGRNPRAVLFDSTDDLVWCSFNSDTICAIDGQGDSLCARVAVASVPSSMCYNPTRNRLYLEDANVTVVNPAARRAEKRILLSYEPVALCWAKSSNKMYCAGRNEASVAVFNNNLFEKLIPVGRGPVALVHDRPLGILCCADSADSAVSIIDCRGDSVIATVKVGLAPKRICVDTILHKAWCSSDSAVAAIDLQAESLTAVMRVPALGIPVLLADPARARVYCATAYDAHVIVLDAVEDSIIASIPVGADVEDLALNPGANLIYCATQENSAVAVIDGASLEVVNIIPAGDYPWALFYNGLHNKLYCANGYGEQSVTVIDCGAPMPVATIRLSFPVMALAYDPTADRLYCLDSYDGYVAIVDCRQDTLLKTLRVGSRPVAAAYSASWRRMYVANQYGSSVTVIRDTARVGIEAPDDLPTVARPMPTVIRGVLHLPRDMGAGHDPIALGESGLCPKPQLLDVEGRKVMDLKPGANDLSRLAPGVYFVREAQVQAQAQTVRKVVLTR